MFGYNVRTSNEIEPQFTSTQYITQTDAHIWPMHKHDAQRTGRSPYDTSQNKGGEKWKYFIDCSLWGTPVIDHNETIYLGTSYDGLHAVNPDGTKKWRSNLVGREYQSPAVAPDGTIYVGTMKWFYAFYPNGTLKWIFNISGNFFCEPVVDSSGTVYVGTQDGFVYAIYSNGTLKWEYEVLDYVFLIALDQNENIYFNGIYRNRLFCFNPNGSLKWSFKEINIWNGPVIGDDGTVYIVSDQLIALYPNGTVKWIFDFLENDWYGYPSIAPDGTIIISGISEYVTALNPADASLIWQYKIGERAPTGDVSTAVIGKDGSIYFAYEAYSNSVAFLVALNPDGSLKWETSLTTDIQPYDGVSLLSDPSIGSDGTVFITSWFFRGGSNYTHIGYIHAIGMDNPVAPKPPSIVGPSNAKLFRFSEYILTCDLPAQEDVYYFIDWDDEEDNVNYANNWIGPFSSDEEVKVKHFWKIWGKHTIKVKIKTDDSLCSPWSYFDVKVVGLSRNRENYNSLFYNLLEQFPILQKILVYIL